ncbi:Yip1 domain-containing protein [Azospirillaceae bacterium]
MPTTRELAFSLFGAYRLALSDARGMAYLDTSGLGAWRSFFVAALLLPANVPLILFRLADHLNDIPFYRLVLIELVFYIISWTAYAVAMEPLTRMLGRSSRYPGFLCAYNWSSVLQMSVYLPAFLLAESGLLPGSLGDVIVVIVTLLTLQYQWFVTRVSLDVSRSSAVGLVVLDLIFSVFVTNAADALLL